MTTELQSIGRRLVGGWTTEGAHPALPGEIIRGSSAAEWMEGEKFLVFRTHTDHPEFPDSLSVLGDTTGLHMHYFDTRGVYRLFNLEGTADRWSVERGPQHDGDFSQRMMFDFGGAAEEMRMTSQIRQDGEAWEDDYEVLYRRQ